MRIQGPYLNKTRTLLQKALGDENVLLVKLAEEMSDDALAMYRKIAKEGIPVGLRRYKFFGNFYCLCSLCAVLFVVCMFLSFYNDIYQKM